jgi:PhnB protein
MIFGFAGLLKLFFPKNFNELSKSRSPGRLPGTGESPDIFMRRSVMQLHPYLCFEGRCEEAIEFYQQALDAELVMCMRTGELPSDAAGGCQSQAESSPDKIVHAQLKIGSAEIMMSDGMNSGRAEFKGITLSVSVDNEQQVEARFKALTADGGTVLMAPSKTFFASSWGICADKFGVNWMVLAPLPVAV